MTESYFLMVCSGYVLVILLMTILMCVRSDGNVEEEDPLWRYCRNSYERDLFVRRASRVDEERAIAMVKPELDRDTF